MFLPNATGEEAYGRPGVNKSRWPNIRTRCKMSANGCFGYNLSIKYAFVKTIRILSRRGGGGGGQRGFSDEGSSGRRQIDSNGRP